MAAAMGMPVLHIKALVFLIKAPVLRLTAQAPRLKTSVLYPGTPIHQARPDLNPQKHTTFVSSPSVTVGLAGGQIFRQGAFVIVGRTVALPAKFTVPQTLTGFLIPATLGLSVLLVFVYLFVYKNAGPEPKIDSPRDSFNFHDCFVDTQSLSKIQINNLNDYIEIYNLCNSQIYISYKYNDFGIRKEKFLRQELDERVNLWLIVIITISVVLMSAIQLLMSYKIALSGKEYRSSDATFAIKHGEISFKSS
jgi:hypothetical protein